MASTVLDLVHLLQSKFTYLYACKIFQIKVFSRLSLPCFQNYNKRIITMLKESVAKKREQTLIRDMREAKDTYQPSLVAVEINFKKNEPENLR